MTPTGSAGSPAAALEGVTKRYGSTTAVDAVSVELFPGEVHALLGENGAGKSTLIALLTGRLSPDAGVIRVEGVPVTLRSPRQALRHGMAAVYQHPALAASLTVAENFLLADGPWWSRPQRLLMERRIKELGDRFGMRVRPEALVSDLSLGERHEVQILRAAARRCRVMLLDEPTAMLTPSGAEQLGRLMRRFAASGMAVVFVTHRLGEAIRYCDRITVLRRGRVAGSVPPPRMRSTGEAALAAEIVEAMFGRPVEGPGRALARRPRHPAPETILQAENLVVSKNEIWPGLGGVSFALTSGEVLGVAGIDGNGQKLLAEVLAGQRRADSGTVILGGTLLDGHGVEQRRQAGLRYLTDDRLGEGTVGAFPVSLNLFLKQIGTPPLWRWSVERRQRIYAEATRLTRMFGVGAAVDAPVAKLSGGNVQKLLLARELSDGVRVIILNKPTHGLDLAASTATRERISELAGRGVAIVLISSDLDELLALCDRIAVMVSGCLVGTIGNDGAARNEVARLMTGAA